MIKRLRIRIIAFAITAFALVIFCVSILVNLITYRIVTRQADETLASIINFEKQKDEDGQEDDVEHEKRPPIPQFMGKRNPEAEYVTRFFIVRYDDDGNVIQVTTDNISTDSKNDTENLAAMVIEKSQNIGYINEYRYLKEKNRSENIIVFLNVFQDQQHLKTLRIITIIVAVFSLLVVSVIIMLFSKAAIKPIVQNIEQQKRFITDASHELKTPLTSIMTSLDVIDVENKDNEWTVNIRNQANRLKKLVGELVFLSRLDEAKPLYQKEDFSMSDISWEILEIYQSSAKAQGREIKTDIEDGLMIRADRGAIGQMISVLMDNAIRYSKGEGEIRYKLYGNHNKVNLEISNPTEYKEPIDAMRLFDRFYRPDSSRNANDGGSGIGLAIAKSVVLAHGGRITANCPDGKEMIIKVRMKCN